MKKILLLLVLLISISSYSQTLKDSINTRIQQERTITNWSLSSLNNKTNVIQYGLLKYYEQEQISQTMYYFGLGSAGLGLLTLSTSKNNKIFTDIKGLSYGLFGLSTVCFIVGQIVHIDANKWLKRASFGVGSNEISLKINL